MTSRGAKEQPTAGGFVFSPIHNVQTGVLPENVVAMFETAREYGVYR